MNTNQEARVEYLFKSEKVAYRMRRAYISRGFGVSLIAFDPGRGAYAFDVYLASE